MDFFNYSDDEIFEFAAPILLEMKEGTNSSDYALFSKHFSVNMLKMVNKNKFISQNEKNIPLLGTLTAQHRLGLIRKQTGVSIIYRQQTSNTRAELLGQLFLDFEDGEIKVFNACIN